AVVTAWSTGLLAVLGVPRRPMRSARGRGGTEWPRRVAGKRIAGCGARARTFAAARWTSARPLRRKAWYVLRSLARKLATRLAGAARADDGMSTAEYSNVKQSCPGGHTRAQCRAQR